MKKRLKNIILTDWNILPSWGKGLAIGAITGSVLLALSCFLILKDPLFIYLPPVLLVLSIVAGIIIYPKKEKIKRNLFFIKTKYSNKSK